MINVVNNNQSIGNITQSTVHGCNLFGDYNTLVKGDYNQIGHTTLGDNSSVDGKISV